MQHKTDQPIQVKELIQRGYDLIVKGEPHYEQAITMLKQALAICESDNAYYESHSHLYTLHLLVFCMSRLVVRKQGQEYEDVVTEVMQYAQRELSLYKLEKAKASFAFKLEVEREAGNTLAWYLMKRNEPGRALEVVQLAVHGMEGKPHYYIYDTKVRILLELGRIPEAYKIVDHVLHDNPGFKDFEDIEQLPDFIAWKAANSRFRINPKWKTWDRQPLRSEIAETIKDFFSLLNNGNLEDAKDLVGHKFDDWEAQMRSLWADVMGYEYQYKEMDDAWVSDAGENEWRKDSGWLGTISPSEIDWMSDDERDYAAQDEFFQVYLLHHGEPTDISAEFCVGKLEGQYYIIKGVMGVK